MLEMSRSRAESVPFCDLFHRQVLFQWIIFVVLRQEKVPVKLKFLY